MIPFIETASAVIVVVLLTFIVPYCAFKSVFKRKDDPAAQAKSVRKNLTARGFENPDEIIKEADGFFENRRYRKTSIYAYDETELYARLYTPAGGEAGKTVLLAHGFDSSANVDFYRIFDFYINHGFNVLLIHQRAHGKSGGRYKSMGIAESYDVLSWCQWLEMRFSTGCPVIIHGVDQGAFAAFCAAGMPSLPANVKAIICENLYNNVEKKIKKNVKKKVGFLTPISMPFIKNFYKSIIGFDMRGATALRLAKRLRVPVMFIMSKNCASISPEMTEKIIEKISVPSSSVLIEKQSSASKKEKEIKKFILR